MTDTINTFMEEAIKLAKEAMQECIGGPFGAVVVHQGKIIGRGQNCVTSTNDPTAHAEIQAIRDACKNLATFQLQDCEIYTSCEPCPMCMSAIYWARIKKIYYAANQSDAAAVDFDDKYIYEQLRKTTTQRHIESQQLLREEALLLFKAWERMEHKTRY